MTTDVDPEVVRHQIRLRVAERIRQRMAEMDRTPVWLSRVIGVDLSVISRWLSGEKPIPSERLREIAIALHRRAEWFRVAEEDAAADPTPPEVAVA